MSKQHLKTMATRYTLLYKGKDSPTSKELEQVGAKVNILDSSRKTLLVETTKHTTDELIHQLPDWVVEQDYTYPIPTTQPDIKKQF